MRTASLAAVVFVLAAGGAAAAVDGVVVNRTTGDPQPETIVTLYQLGADGMQPVESVRTDDAGAFRVDADVNGPHLLQTIHGGATYNRMLQPGQPTTGLELEVYDSSADSDTAHVSQHMVVIEPMGSILHISETVVLHNEGTVAYNDPENGTLRVFLPAEMQSEPQVMVSGPQGVPIERPAIQTPTDNVYMVDYPAKPGETRFDLTYVLPTPEDGVFSGRALHDGGPLRLVVPNSVSIAGAGIQELGQDPSTGAIVYEVDGSEYSVTVQGTGQLSRSAEAASAPPSGSDIQAIAARIYDRASVVVGLTLLILLAGFLYLYRRSAV